MFSLKRLATVLWNVCCLATYVLCRKNPEFVFFWWLIDGLFFLILSCFAYSIFIFSECISSVPFPSLCFGEASMCVDVGEGVMVEVCGGKLKKKKTC